MFKFPSISIEIITSLLKLYLLFKLYDYFGIIIGILLMIVVVKLYKILLCKLLNAKILGSTDRLFLGSNHIELFTLVGIVDLTNFSAKRIEEKLQDAFRKVPKLSSRLIYFLGNYFWKHVPVTEERYNNIVFNKKMKNYEYVFQFVRNEVNIPLNIEENCFEAYIITYTNEEEKGNGALVFKFDHSFSDGMNILSFMISLSDNFSEDLFPKTIKKAYFSYFNYVIRILEFIVFGWFVFFKVLTLKTSNKLITKERSGKANIGHAQIFPLATFKKLAKALDVKINDIVVGLVTSTIKKMSPESTDLCVCIPVGNTKLPKSLSKVTLCNLASGITVKLSLISDITEECKTTSKELQKLLSHKFVSDTATFVTQITCEFLPLYWVKLIGYEASEGVDMTISNLPGPMDTLIYNECKVKSIFPYSSLGPSKSFILIFSYCDSIYVTPNFDPLQNIDPELFSKYFKQSLEEAKEKLIRKNSY